MFQLGDCSSAKVLGIVDSQAEEQKEEEDQAHAFKDDWELAGNMRMDGEFALRFCKLKQKLAKELAGRMMFCLQDKLLCRARPCVELVGFRSFVRDSLARQLTCSRYRIGVQPRTSSLNLIFSSFWRCLRTLTVYD